MAKDRDEVVRWHLNGSKYNYRLIFGQSWGFYRVTISGTREYICEDTFNISAYIEVPASLSILILPESHLPSLIMVLQLFQPIYMAVVDVKQVASAML